MIESTVLKNAIRACRDSVTAVAVFSGVSNLLMLVPAFFMLNVYDKAIGSNSLDTLWALSIVAAFMFAMLASMEWVRSRVLVAISSRLDRLISPRLYEAGFARAVTDEGNSGAQSLMDLGHLRQFITSTGIVALFDAPWLPIYILVLFLFHPMLGWMGIIAALVFATLAFINQKRSAASLEKANELNRQNVAETTKNLRNAEVIEAMGMLSNLQSLWRQRQDELLVAQEQASNVAGLFNAIIKTLRLAVQSAAIAAGAYLVLAQEISPGMLIAGSILIGRALQPVELAVGAWRGFIDAKGQYTRLEKMLTAFPLDVEKMELPKISGAISARSVAIGPPRAKKPIVANLNFEIPAGAVCMVLGASGAGKSTVVRGLLGLWPAMSGEIRIDGAAARSYDRHALGSQVGYLPQGIELFDGTVAQNIARFGPIDSEAVIQAAQDAGVHELILSLGEGYDTILGKAGGLLSPGQQQRIALARAVYLRPRLVVMDEPNSNLDDVGEIALAKTIKSLSAMKSTVILVSHRKSILPVADYLLILASGQQVEFGPAKQVLERVSVAAKSENSPPQIGRDHPDFSKASERAVTFKNL